MISEMQKARLWVVVAAIGIVAAQQPVGAGVVVVNWGGDYVTSTQSLKEGTNPPPSGTDSYVDIHSATDSSTTPSTNYYGRLNFNDQYNPDAVNSSTPNSKFYGGHVVVTQPKNGSTNGNVGMSNLWIANNVQSDYLEVDVNPSNSLKKFAMLTYWETPKDKIYKFNGDSVFTLFSSQDAGDKPDGHKVRWVVRDGGNYYLSEGINFSNSTSYTSSGSALTGMHWFAFNPTPTGRYNLASLNSFKSLLFTEPPSGPDTSGLSFQDINAVGFYVEFTPTGNPGADKVHYKVQGFNVSLDPNGNSVPEPSTFLLGLAGFGGVALKRWRQRRKAGGTDAAQLTEAAT